LTLVTSHPAYSSGKRLAVAAKLQGGAPGASPAAGPFIVGESESGLAGDTSALGPLVLWLQALAALAWLTWRAARRWPATAVYVIASPLLLAVIFMAFTQLSRLLPATL
ncbi:MAG: hypothetical protein ACRDIU_08935, partial [Actinomycetota bacterium]